MSVKPNVYLTYGVSITKAETTLSKPNPLYGVHAFDPSTGEKVTKSKKVSIDIEQLANDCNLMVLLAEEGEVTYIGTVIAVLSGYSDAAADVEPLSPEAKEEVNNNIAELQANLNSYGLELTLVPSYKLVLTFH